MPKYCLKKSQRDYMDNDPFYTLCIHENIWDVDIEYEHSLTYRGRRIQEIFAVVAVRRIYNRNPPAKVKAFNQFIALWRLVGAENEYCLRMKEKYFKTDFESKIYLIEQRFGFNIYNPEFEKIAARLDKYRITKNAP